MSIRDITYMGEGLIPAPLDGPALRYTRLYKSAVTDIAIHHWTGFIPPATWTADEEIAYCVRIDQYHRTGRGLDGIGYQLAPFPSGRAYIVSQVDCYGAHVGGHNNHTIGIGLPGTFNLQTPSPQHLEATIEAMRYVYEHLGRDAPASPHLLWGGTTCPGDRWPEWVPQLREQALQEDDMTDEQLAAILAAIAAHDASMQGRRDQVLEAIAAHDASMQGRRDQVLEAIADISTGGGPSADAIADELARRLQD